MTQESWHEARLIPTSGINGAEEQERRATSALLAVMSAVKEFGRTITQQCGAHAGQVQTYIEVPFKLGDQTVIPDGLIQVTRGSKTWTALVEVKTGQNELAATQLENYLDVAREQGFDALITISNEIPPVAGQHPTKVDRRKTKRVAMHHLSWTQVLASAVLQKEFRGVADPDQAWILGELIRYLEHPRSGAMEFDDMGASWVAVRDAVRNGTLRSNDKGVGEVANRFDALLRYASLRLGRQLGTEVTPVLARKELADPTLRTQALVSGLVGAGTLSGAIRIPSTVGNIVVDADLRAGIVTCSVEVDAPREGRPTTRVNWLVRQLKNAPETVRIETKLAHQRGAGPTELLRTVRETPASIASDGTREIRSFQVALARPMGTKRGRGRGSFIDSVLDSIDEFYGEVVQQIKAWSAAPPRLRTEVEIAGIAAEQPDVPASLVSTAVSSQDDDRP